MYNVLSDTYNMTLRGDHNTGAIGIGHSVPRGTVMKADEIWTATADLWKTINGVNVKINAVNDKWAHIIEVGGATQNAWTAVVHIGKVYCAVTEIGNPPPPPVSVFPQSFTLTDPSGAKAEYIFVRIL